MPIYEYSCEKCGEVIERIQKFSDPPLKKHAECGGTLTKLISQSAFQLKGTGWYVTDYAKSGAPKEPSKKEGSEGSDDSGKSSDGKSEKKEKPSKPKEKSGSGK